MKRLLYSGLVAGLLATVAAAQDASWTITGTTSVVAGSPVSWQASVDVVDDASNQGLGGYAFHVVVGPSPGPTPGADNIWGTADDSGLANVQLSQAGFDDIFQVTGSSPPPGSVEQTGNSGGPGMTTLPQGGTNTLNNGELLQVGASHLAWAAFPGSDGQTAGVGLPSRKGDLLDNPAGDYGVHSGTIPTTGLADGNYTVTLIPVATRTLRVGIDFSMDQAGFIMQDATSVGSSFEFTVSGTIPPDLDGDSDVDGTDFLTFSNCFNGALNPPLGICENPAADLDNDGDVDGTDFLTFSNCFNGALNPPGPACAF